MSEETIHINEEDLKHSERNSREWQEEFKVASSDVVESVKRLLKESNVRRVVIRRSNGQTLMNIPVWAGIAGVALLPVLSGLGVIAAMVTECSILVERAE
ncbi:MAG: DUF4342 domain-containing protein [Anaerolineales bacterium]|nr:DUF4342 domain-containing protein [Anaerolineales bacterium]